MKKKIIKKENIFKIPLEDILVAYKVGRITLQEAVWIIKRQ